MELANTLAYYDTATGTATGTAVKSFIVQAFVSQNMLQLYHAI
jgi:hypothetical protein